MLRSPDSATTPTDTAPPPVAPLKRLLADCASEYIAETAEHKSVKTLAAYKLTVTAFCERGKKEHIEDITREDILTYSTALRKKGCSPRTIRNRIDHLQIFFHRFKIPSLLTGNDLPKYTDKKVRAYNPLELGKLFGHATADQSNLLHFLLCTGAREQEAQFVCWSDVDLERQTYTVTEYLDLGYRPKDKEEGTLPIPELLVQTLKDRRKRYPHTRLIFTGKRGKPNGHALRTIKRLALRAGVNCGQCVNKARKSCATHPVCRHILLHKIRKTFASTLHHKELPAQTLQRYLRHSELSTTLAYITDQPDDQVRYTINSTFSGFARVGGAT
jgi:integrase/recombinase XerD